MHLSTWHPDVVAADGGTLGPLVDATILFDERDAQGFPYIRRLLVGRRPGEQQLRSPGPGVDLSADPILLPAPPGPSEPFDRTRADGGLAPGELLLRRDVLDTQVVDVDGRRLARISDVVLEPTADGGLVVVALDVGFGTVVRRLGLRRLGHRMGEEVLGWNSVHLTSSTAHRVQLASTRAAVHHLSPEDLAEVLGRVSTQHAADLLGAMPPSRAGAVLLASPAEIGHRLVRALPPHRTPAVIDHVGRHAPERATQLRHALHLPAIRRRRFGRHAGWRRVLPRRPRKRS